MQRIGASSLADSSCADRRVVLTRSDGPVFQEVPVPLAVLVGDEIATGTNAAASWSYVSSDVGMLTLY
jgi:hypothetical protein